MTEPTRDHEHCADVGECWQQNYPCDQLGKGNAMTKAYFTMSEAQCDEFPDWESRELTVELGDLGAQLTYDTLRDCATSGCVAFFRDGYWIAEADGREYSDVVIFTEGA